MLTDRILTKISSSNNFQATYRTMSASDGAKKPSKSKFSVQLRELLNVSKKFSSHVEEIGELDQMIQERTSLQEELQMKAEELKQKEDDIELLQTSRENELASLRVAKDKEISELQLRNDTLFEEFKSRYDRWKSNNEREKQMEAKLVELEEKLHQAVSMLESSRNECKFLKQQTELDKMALEESAKHLEIVNRTLGSRENELEGTRKNLESAKKPWKKRGWTWAW